MKALKLFIAAMLLFILFFAGCIVQIVSVQPSPAASAPSTLQLISLVVLGIYEVVVRAVPSVGKYSVVSWFITALKFVSDKLNVTKNQ